MQFGAPFVRTSSGVEAFVTGCPNNSVNRILRAASPQVHINLLWQPRSASQVSRDIQRTTLKVQRTIFGPLHQELKSVKKSFSSRSKKSFKI